MVLARFLIDSCVIRHEAHATKAHIRALQLKRFRRLAAFVSQNSPYYARIISEAHINLATCVPEDFPILTKDEVITHFDSIVTDPRVTKAAVQNFLKTSHNPEEKFLDTYYVVHTSGSSGTVGHYLYTEAELVKGIAPIALAGKTRLLQRLAYVATTQRHFAGITMAVMARKLSLLYADLQTFDSSEPFASTVRKLNAMQPTIVTGYALSLKRLAEAQAAGILHITPDVLQSGGELLTQRDKAYIQKVFGVLVTNIYASSEHLVMGIGRDDLKGMYLIDSNLIIEPNPTSTIVTNLYNYTLPLIRYQMTDVLELASDKGSVFAFQKMSTIVGRHEYSPVFINNEGKKDFISSHLFDFNIESVKRMQIHVLGDQHFVVKVCLEADRSARAVERVVREVGAYLDKLLAEKLMDTVAYEIEIVDDLPIDPKTGKFQLVLKG